MNSCNKFLLAELQVYYSEEIISVPVEMIEGKCEVRKRNDLPNVDFPVVIDHVFFCDYSYDPVNGALNQVYCLLCTLITSIAKTSSFLLIGIIFF